MTVKENIERYIKYLKGYEMPTIAGADRVVWVNGTLLLFFFMDDTKGTNILEKKDKEIREIRKQGGYILIISSEANVTKIKDDIRVIVDSKNKPSPYQYMRPYFSKNPV